jgi:hypothetical protein
MTQFEGKSAVLILEENQLSNVSVVTLCAIGSWFANQPANKPVPAPPPVVQPAALSQPAAPIVAPIQPTPRQWNGLGIRKVHR